MIAEQAGDNLVLMGRIGLEADRGATAVARDEGSDSLADERFQILQGLFLDSEPVIVGMGVKKAGRDAESVQVDGPVSLFFKTVADGGDPLVFHEDVTFERGAPRSVINDSVFEQCTHDSYLFLLSSSFSSTV